MAEQKSSVLQRNNSSSETMTFVSFSFYSPNNMNSRAFWMLGGSGIFTPKLEGDIAPPHYWTRQQQASVRGTESWLQALSNQARAGQLPLCS